MRPLRNDVTDDVMPIKFEDGKFTILDQTLLPGEERYIELNSLEDVFFAIKSLQVRGAPAIGVAAALGLYVALRNTAVTSLPEFEAEFRSAKEFLSKSRPTAVNLFWALNRMESRFSATLHGLSSDAGGAPPDPRPPLDILLESLLDEALRIRQEDENACMAMGEHGLSLLREGMCLLTHCNAGALATSRYGTALSPVHLGQKRGYGFKVFVDETRPLLQGARLTAWELLKSGADVTLICDNMAAAAMKNGWIDAALVGCDRMAANGDGANKIGTAGLAVLAKAYNVPFYMFVPTSTIDMGARSGDDIPIEIRDGEEVRSLWYKKPLAPSGVKVWNPAFDVTAHEHITAIVTEKGVIRPPFDEGLRALLNG
ncbi:MAG: S-methyl-5-thioribose-1-phosphate isomerase [Clostridiales Family XIII bacterium]|jgi:methylthioribose-1-phosphate isomerase|nr:S-methyl-5-thioribose-1-phosphate isomerase [Clostridiales Family XIII bacterium]